MLKGWGDSGGLQEIGKFSENKHGIFNLNKTIRTHFIEGGKS